MASRSKNPAFTLVEVLVVITVIALLIAISIPALAGARVAAREAVSLSNMRQSAIAMHTYTAAHDSTYPYFEAGTWLLTTPLGDIPISAIHPGHYDLSLYWPTLMHDLLPWHQHFESWVGPGSWEGRPWDRNGFAGGSASYHLTRSFLSRPEAWDPGVTDDAPFRRPVRLADVHHPSSKVMLYDQDLTQRDSLKIKDRDPDRRPAAFPDGHAAQKRRSKARAPAAIQWNDVPVAWDDTPDGARGSDY